MRASEVREILGRLGMRADKRLGQHFLIDDRIARRQVEFAGIKRSETVLEIGPGLGALTRLLLRKTENVVTVEKNRRFCRYLEDELPSLRIIEGDAVKVDLPQFDVVVANLPYQISSPMTFKLLERKFDRAILMFQKEFAERMVAGRGEEGYSRLSVQVYYKSEAEIVEGVPRSAFYPQPEVESAVVSLKPRSPPFKVADEALFSHLVDKLFQHRRKTIENGISLSWRDFGDSLEKVKKTVRRTGFSRKRVEELSPEEIGELSDALVAARGGRPVS